MPTRSPIVRKRWVSNVKVEVPPTRADILHACDVVEDIGIGYGFNNIQKVYPPTNTVGSF